MGVACGESGCLGDDHQGQQDVEGEDSGAPVHHFEWRLRPRRPGEVRVLSVLFS